MACVLKTRCRHWLVLAVSRSRRWRGLPRLRAGGCHGAGGWLYLQCRCARGSAPQPAVSSLAVVRSPGAEPGHKTLLAALQAEPLLALGLRLGEGSGAALAVPLLRLACALHGQMATFAEAAVADRPA